MKKKIAFLLAVLLTLCLSTVAFANAAEVSKEDQMAVMVKNFLDKNANSTKRIEEKNHEDQQIQPRGLS